MKPEAEVVVETSRFILEVTKDQVSHRTAAPALPQLLLSPLFIVIVLFVLGSGFASSCLSSSSCPSPGPYCS